MHRRRSLGLCMLLLMVFLAGTASATELPAPEAKVDKPLDLLSWAWEWLSSLIVEEEASNPGGSFLNGDGGVFIDPCGNS